MAKKVFFGNYKGGVGKTTSVFNIARYLCEDYNKKILLLDLDPQSSLSEICMRYYKENASSGVKDIANDEECLNYIYDLSIRKIQKYECLKLNSD